MPKQRRSSRRRLQIIAVAGLAAVALVLTGVAIGVLLRAPAETRRDALDAAALSHDVRSRDRVAPDVRHRETSELKSDPPGASPGPPVSAAKTRDSAYGRSVAPPPPEQGTDAAGESTAQSAPATVPDVLGTTSASTADAMSVRYQLIDMHRRPSFGLTGISMTQDIRYQILSRLELSPQAPDGSQKVTQVVERSHLDRADEMSRATYETALRDLIGQRYVFTLNAHGEIIEFTGFTKTTTAAPISRPGEEGFMVVTVIDQDGWKELAQLTFLQPDRTIAAGQPWKRPMAHDWSPLGSWHGTTTYTQRGPEGTAMRYDYRHEMSFVPSEAMSGVLPFDITGAKFQALKAEGWFVFDSQRRHTTSVHEQYHVEGTVGAGLLAGATELQLQEIQETTIQISDQNPWAHRQ
ncbi:MAG: hypothetical protein ACYC0X_07455 [Pirellulaceae bacterium]